MITGLHINHFTSYSNQKLEALNLKFQDQPSGLLPIAAKVAVFVLAGIEIIGYTLFYPIAVLSDLYKPYHITARRRSAIGTIHKLLNKKTASTQSDVPHPVESKILETVKVVGVLAGITCALYLFYQNQESIQKKIVMLFLI